MSGKEQIPENGAMTKEPVPASDQAPSLEAPARRLSIFLDRRVLNDPPETSTHIPEYDPERGSD